MSDTTGSRKEALRDVGLALKHAGRAIGLWWSETFELAILFLAFVVAIPINGQVGGVITGSSLWLSGWFVPDPYADYESAIIAAAVKRPEYQVKLATIDQNMKMVPVVSFGPGNPIAEKRSYNMWVALPAELKAACAGAGDPLLKLQQVLGLGPDPASKYVVTQLSVPRTALFRPCLGPSDLGSDSCGVSFFELPQENDPAKADSATTVATNSAAAAAATTTAEATKAVAAQISATNVSIAKPDNTTADAAKTEYYERLTFVARQMWNTYRIGFARTQGRSTGYPYTGYPFTGMGWTYNWGRGANHVGVSEFILRGEPKIEITGSQTPAAFCQQAAS